MWTCHLNIAVGAGRVTCKTLRGFRSKQESEYRFYIVSTLLFLHKAPYLLIVGFPVVLHRMNVECVAGVSEAYATSISRDSMQHCHHGV